MEEMKKVKTILLIEKLRFVENELFRFTSKYGVKTIDELDRSIAKSKLSEEALGEDLFIFDSFLSEKVKLENDLHKFKVTKNNILKNFQDLLELPKLSFRK